MTAMSYAERARRFLAERAAVIDGGCERSDKSDESLPRPDLSSLSSLSSQPDSGSSASAEQAASCEQSDESDERGDAPTEGVWWDDQVSTGSAPILCLPPRTCIAPRACARLGPCERQERGESCEIISPRRANVPEGDSR